MVSVASLLNPSPPIFERLRDTPDSASSSSSREGSPYPSSLLPFKKQKMHKGASNLVMGEPKGKVKYPPYEIQDTHAAAEYRKYEVKPIGQISDYPKRIPYNSDKKSFQQKTGRDGFEGMNTPNDILERWGADKKYQSTSIPSECLEMTATRTHIA